MILNSLGEALSEEFKACGHDAVKSARGGELILDDLNSGSSSKVRNGLHQLAGHARKEIVTTLPEQMRALTGIAGGVACGDFPIDTHGNLLAGSQVKTAMLGKEAGRPCNPESVLAVYEKAISSARTRGNSNFKAWLTGTTVAGLRESSAPTEAEKFLITILKDGSISGDLRVRGPSQLREVLLVAAPKLCMPALFETYDLALQYGSSRERGLALHNVSKLPEIISQLGPSHPRRGELLARCKTYADAVDNLLDQSSVVADASNPNQRVGRAKIAQVRDSLKSAGR